MLEVTSLFGFRALLLAHPYLAVVVTYAAYLVLSRLVFHPLSCFPGPKLAALTELYELYFSAVKDGQYPFHLEKLHEQYGPIVRVNPWELHICDPEFYDTIYALKHRDKIVEHAEYFDAPLSTTATTDHDLHRQRRAAINASFSKPAVLEFEPHIQASVIKFIGRLKEWEGTNIPVNLADGFFCYAGDMIGEFCFGYDRKFLSSPNFEVPPLLQAFDQLLRLTHFNMQFPFLMKFVKRIPDRFLPDVILNILNFKRGIHVRMENMLTGKHHGRQVPWVTKLLNNPHLPAHEKSLQRICDETVTFVGAGEATTKHTLGIAMFYLLQQPDTWRQLKEEILTIFPDVNKPPSLTQLEKLPLLSSTVTESLRLSYGEVGRSPRVSQDPIPYGPYTIPPGTPISMGQYSMHHHELLFPSSHTFIAQRFMHDAKVPSLPCHDGTMSSGTKKLSRYMTSFNKGTRQCLGMHFGYAEIYLMIANLVKRCDLVLWETEYRDVGFMRDFATPFPAADARGLRVLVRGVE